MIFSITPSASTKILTDALANAKKIVEQANKKALTEACLIFQAKSKQESPIASSNLRKNIKYEVESDGSQAKVFVDGSIEYARFQEEGTGIHGPKKAYIYPKRARMLAWKGKSGEMIFARRVAGVKPRWYMKQGKEEVENKRTKISAVLFDNLKGGLKI